MKKIFSIGIAGLVLFVLGCTSGVSKEDVGKMIDDKASEEQVVKIFEKHRDAVIEGKDFQKYDNTPLHFSAKGFKQSDLIESIGVVMAIRASKDGKTLQRGGSTAVVTEEYVFVSAKGFPNPDAIDGYFKEGTYGVWLYPLVRDKNGAYGYTTLQSEILPIKPMNSPILSEVGVTVFKRINKDPLIPLLGKRFSNGKFTDLERGDFLYVVGADLDVPGYMSWSDYVIVREAAFVALYESGQQIKVGFIEGKGPYDSGDIAFALRDGNPEVLGLISKLNDGNIVFISIDSLLSEAAKIYL